MRVSLLILSVSIVILVAVQPAVASHPAEGKELPEYAEFVLGPHTGYEDGWDINDLTFPAIGESPSFDQLTFLEIYMVCGVVWEVDGRQHGLNPWSTLIYQAVEKFYEEFAYVPDILDEPTLRSIPGFEDIPAEKLAEYRNPLTGDWPRMDARAFSPGDCYIRPLTEDEMVHFAGLNETYRNHWYDGQAYSLTKDEYVPVQLLSEPFYVRIYGLSDVLLVQIQYSWTEL